MSYLENDIYQDESKLNHEPKKSEEINACQSNFFIYSKYIEEYQPLQIKYSKYDKRMHHPYLIPFEDEKQ